MCASTLYFLKPDGKVKQFFVGIGRRELASHKPDAHWLEAVVHGLGSSNDQCAVEVLVTIFERADLPGKLRGDAADKLGCCAFAQRPPHPPLRALSRRCDSRSRRTTRLRPIWEICISSARCAATEPPGDLQSPQTSMLCCRGYGRSRYMTTGWHRGFGGRCPRRRKT